MAIPIPDFTGLANQQGGINQAVAGQQTLANRPEQNNAWGGVSWTQGPNGQWTQNVNMTPGGQGIFDQTMAGQGTLAGQVTGGLNYNNVPGLMSAAGTSQQTIDANMALQQPFLQQARDRENTRLAAMGMTMGAQGYNDTQRNLADMDQRAYQNAILAGNQEYGNIFNRALQARQQGVQEANSMYSGALQGLQGLGTLKDSLDPTKHLANVPGATGYTAPNVYNAGMDTYNAQLAQNNADMAAKANRQAGLMGLAGDFLSGGGLGQVGGLLGQGYNWASNNGWFGGGGDAGGVPPNPYVGGGFIDAGTNADYSDLWNFSAA